MCYTGLTGDGYRDDPGKIKSMKVSLLSLVGACALFFFFGGAGCTYTLSHAGPVFLSFFSPVRVSYAGAGIGGELSRHETQENAPEEAEEPGKASYPLSAVFTRYSAGDEYTPGRIMASGREVYIGAVACPRSMALGTRIDVENIGVLTCEDRKSARFDDFDIYTETPEKALSIGTKTLSYRILDKEK